MLLSGGLKVWVEVDGKAAEEWKVAHSSKGVLNETSCFIEAIEGKRFRLRFSGLITLPHSQTLLQVHVDGQWVASRAFCRYDPKAQGGSIDGFAERIGGDIPTIREFVFSKAQTTDEVSSIDIPQHLEDEGCTIRFDIQILTRSGRMHHISEKEAHCEHDSKLVVHKDTKPAAFGILTDSGAIINRTTTLRHCKCDVKPEAQFHQRVIFHYLPMTWLEPLIHDEQVKAGLVPKTVLNMEDDGAQEISRVHFEAGIQSKEASEKSAAETSKQSEREVETGSMIPPKRRAGSEPLIDSKNFKEKRAAQTFHVNIDTLEHIVESVKIKRENLDSMAAAPCHINIDISSEGDEYTVIKDPPVVIDLCDD